MSAAVAVKESESNQPANFEPGKWAIEAEGQYPEIGKIKAVYWDNISKEWVMDIVLYSSDGTRIGRSSPRCGGPSGFEPAVPCKYWVAVTKPDFPLSLDSTGYRDWRKSLQVIA
jgi:hypothetical protein